jgi:hypothetical protein
MKFKKLRHLYLDGEISLKEGSVPAAVNPCLNDREAFKLKHGVYPYDDPDIPPWDESLSEVSDGSES